MLLPLLTPVLAVAVFFTTARSHVAHAGGGRGREGCNKTCEAYGDVAITYQETFICETTPGVKAFSGYVHLPSTLLADSQDPVNPYNLSTFFWYFHARNSPETAPLAFYFAGGPGESSMYGAMLDGGPCSINPDSNSTTLNPFSFNEYSNILYIDQPAGVGFSYQTILNSTWNLLGEDEITPVSAYGDDIPPQNSTLLYGLYADQNPNLTVSTTPMAARQMWAFAQTWLTKFPEYKTKNKRINLLGNSYTGFWGMGFMQYFQQQNEKIEKGEICGYRMPLDTLGVSNGCIDSLYTSTSYAEMAYNNTYGVEFISKETYDQANQNYTMPGGCRDRIIACREIGSEGDPESTGLNATVNEVCAEATLSCWVDIQGEILTETGRSAFDLAQGLAVSSPPYYIEPYMKHAWVKEALGVPLDFTENSIVVADLLFAVTGDPFRFEGLKALEYLLDAGIKVALVFGDRDLRCNWVGGETISLLANWTGAEAFRTAGYEMVQTNETYQGGVVRQHGGFSFTRLFQSGHDAAWFQPQTTQEIFNRAMFDKDIATGLVSTSGDDSSYSSTGLASSFGIRDVLPAMSPGLCQIWQALETCSPTQLAAIENGTAVVVDYIVVEPGPDPVS